MTLEILLQIAVLVGLFYSSQFLLSSIFITVFLFSLLSSEFIQLLAAEAQEISEKEGKKTILADHIVKALEVLGFSHYTSDVTDVFDEFKLEVQVSCFCSFCFQFLLCSISYPHLLFHACRKHMNEEPSAVKPQHPCPMKSCLLNNSGYLQVPEVRGKMKALMLLQVPWMPPRHHRQCLRLPLPLP